MVTSSSSRAKLTSPGVVGLQLLLGGALGIALSQWLTTAAKHLPYQTGILLPLLLVGIVFWLTVLVHESGHWIGGRLTGMRCFAVAVLWLHLERQESRWQLRLRKRRPGSLGHVISLPLGFEQLRRRIALFIAAGPVASLAAGSLALATGWVLRQPYRTGVLPGHIAGYVTAELLFLFGVGSVSTGLLNALPFTTRHGNVSDGERLRRLRRPGPRPN
jgi:membrane-associated protease RseP (regulator of RpoE activity)